MKAEHLIDAAKRFAGHLNETVPGRVTCEAKTVDRVFADVYHDHMPEGSGVYLFHFSNRDVFYIGKTDTKHGTFEKRVWAHFYAPVTAEGGQRTIRTKEIDVTKLKAEDQRLLVNMQFHIDYLVIEPRKLADLFEVYLQSICFLHDNKLPSCNAQFG